MTNPVNAGADIEKELAEAAGFRFRKHTFERENNDGNWVESGDWGSGARAFWNCAIKAMAALLAEAAERKRLEAELEAEVKNHHETSELWAATVTDYTTAVQRASTEAERSRGLEAQLETHVGLLQKARTKLCELEWSDHDESEQEMCPDCQAIVGSGHKPSCELLSLIHALSQLPTPAQQRADNGLLPTCYVCGEVMRGVCPACGATTGIQQT